MKKYLLAVLMAVTLVASITVIPLADPKDPPSMTPSSSFYASPFTISVESVDMEAELPQ